MKLHRYSSMLLSALVMGTIVQAQVGSAKLEINYSAAVPVSSFRNLTNQVSARGIQGSIMFGVSDKLSLGLQSGFQDFYQKYPREVYTETGYGLSAVITNSIQVTPLMAKAKYRFNSTGMVQPYVALAAGGNLISYNKYYGQFVDGKTSIGFAAQPELGIHIPLGAAKRSAFNLSAGYNYMPFKYNDADGLHHASMRAGFSFPLK